MEESILSSIKLALGLPDEYEAFDPQIIMHINSVFTILTELGVGPDDGFKISDKSAIWSDFLEDEKLLELCKSDMYLRIRLMFDPPVNSFVVSSMEKQISEFEWRIAVMIDKIEDKP